MGLRVILADAELELMPQELRDHPAVRRHAQSMNKPAAQLLLDQAHHRPAMRGIPDGDRRGRPDITQYSLLALLESPLGRSGRMEVAIHTRNRRLLRIRPETHLPRGDARFHGVMSRVLSQGASHDRDPLIWVEGRTSAQDVLHRFAMGPVLRMDDVGTLATPLQIADQAVRGDLTVVLGAFPSGTYSAEWLLAAPQAVSVWPEPLNAWAVAAEVAAAFRARHGPFR